VLAGTDRVCRSLGRDPASLTLGEVPPGPDLDRLRARRRELGLPAEDGDPLLLDPATGTTPVDAKRHLAFARLTRTSMEANSGVCRGMLRARYSLDAEEEGTG